MIALVLPYPPSANRYWRHGTIKGRAAVFLSKEAKDYKAVVAHMAKAAGIRQPHPGRTALTIRLYPNRPQDWARRARRDPETWDDTVQCIDLGNCEKVLSDALNGVAWVDDKKHRRIVLERMEPDEKGARVEVEIEFIAIARSLWDAPTSADPRARAHVCSGAAA
ncbi:RusA family crossover junction endodeoxyribonuclease [Stenotrophomonas acidaminiphila]|uniref:RusA family crossover junction endodeoxyribonuclease n=1 Tax=Stenotrophomonas acidaminiphila TaxID=128780 RepID=UPI0028A87F1E|nr:RusA family crossover junction endodeoxyribonuclease [Stenotrophomonas acidaminiphila]